MHELLECQIWPVVYILRTLFMDVITIYNTKQLLYQTHCIYASDYNRWTLDLSTYSVNNNHNNNDKILRNDFKLIYHTT